MKIIISDTPKSLFYILLLFVTTFAVSCSKKVAFVTSTVVPAAEGKIDIDRDENKNYTIDIEVIRLADPSRLPSPKKTYVVWMETDDNGTKNLGQLRSTSGYFTSSLKGTLKAVTPYKPQRVFITAEDYGTAQNPGTQVVLTTKTF